MWLMRRPGEPEQDTWEEYSKFHKDFKYNITVSEFDSEPKVEVFCKEQNLKVHGSDHSATNFLSQYHIETHQGNDNSMNQNRKINWVTIEISDKPSVMY